MTQRWRHAADELVAAQGKASDWTSLYSALTKASRFLLQSAVLATGAYLAVVGEITGGLMIAASIVTSRALAPVEQVVAHWRGYVGARQAAARIRPLLTELRDGQQPTTKLELPTRSLSVVNLSTAPEHGQPPVVSGITFTLTAGEAMGVLGPSGSGKTSLARALVGVWPALRGQIRLDGSEFHHFNNARLGPRIGYLPQSVDLFEGTVAGNVGRFDPAASDAQIFEASKLAGAHELIVSLPQGYDTWIGERGATLSAGQRQRIGLARALYGNPFLLVLDEPNAHLDATGEAALTEALHAAKGYGAIVIVVAHRPSAISAVDKILYVHRGRQAAFARTRRRRAVQPEYLLAGLLVSERGNRFIPMHATKGSRRYRYYGRGGAKTEPGQCCSAAPRANPRTRDRGRYAPDHRRLPVRWR